MESLVLPTQLEPIADAAALVKPSWYRLLKGIVDQSNGRRGPQRLKSYTVADLPSAADNAEAMVFVKNESGGAVPAFSDGSNWRRVTDRAVVS